jgi:hypothetical protein
MGQNRPVGVESDHLIYDYLSRVGDLAQTALPAAQRMRLVAQLRSDIDRQRSRSGSDSPAAVRRILGRLGSPDEVVGAAAGAQPQEEAPQPQPGPREAARAEVPRQAKALEDEEWWRLNGPHSLRRPMLPGEELEGLRGMTGGVTIPSAEELEAEEARKTKAAEDAEEEDEAEEPAEPSRPSRWRRLRERRRPVVEEAEEVVVTAAPRRRAAWLEILAAVLLVAGAVIGSWLALGAGWLIAYYSPRLSRREAKFAALTLPGLVAGGALVWLWGRFDHRWGEPIAQGHMGTAIGDAFPVVVRVAAVASAAFLVWRSRR